MLHTKSLDMHRDRTFELVRLRVEANTVKFGRKRTSAWEGDFDFVLIASSFGDSRLVIGK